MRAALMPVTARLRLLVGDPAGTTQTWTDDELELALDSHRHDWWYWPLTAIPTVTATTTEYHTFVAGDVDGMWDNDTTLYASDQATVLTADSANLTVGQWTFTADQSDNMPLHVSGHTYDLYGAAVDVLEQWKALLKLDAFDFATEGEEFRRSQKLDAIDGLIADYRGQMAPTVGRLRRHDTAPMR